MSKKVGQVAYEAYRSFRKGMESPPVDLPEWALLSSGEQAAWQFATVEVGRRASFQALNPKAGDAWSNFDEPFRILQAFPKEGRVQVEFANGCQGTVDYVDIVDAGMWLLAFGEDS